MTNYASTDNVWCDQRCSSIQVMARKGSGRSRPELCCVHSVFTFSLQVLLICDFWCFLIEGSTLWYHITALVSSGWCHWLWLYPWLLGDSWLDLSPQDLEQILQERAGHAVRGGLGRSGAPSRNQPGQTHSGTEEEAEQEVGYSLVAVTHGMKNFINAMSSYEGAELPW